MNFSGFLVVDLIFLHIFFWGVLHRNPDRLNEELEDEAPRNEDGCGEAVVVWIRDDEKKGFPPSSHQVG